MTWELALDAAMGMKRIYRIIPNIRAGRGDEVGGAFIMCTKMLILISRTDLAAASSLSQATLVRT